MYLWATGDVRPMTKLDDDNGWISGHYVINWMGYAITVRLSGRPLQDSILIKFVCNTGPEIHLSRAKVEDMLIGEVINCPERNEWMNNLLKEVVSRIDREEHAPRRLRGKIS